MATSCYSFPVWDQETDAVVNPVSSLPAVLTVAIIYLCKIPQVQSVHQRS